LKNNAFLILSVLLLFTIKLQAQSTNSGAIRGKIVEEVGGLSIPSAIISIYISGADQPPITSTTSDENGFFSAKNLATGTYRIKVSYVGYVSLLVDGILLSKANAEKNLGNLKLVSDQSTLQEVTVTAEKPVVEFGADGITYNVNSSLLAEGSTATDILKNVPMVQVDIDGNATIAGKQTTRIFIDGKPSDYMTSNIADLLNVLPSDAIEKIEVLTNPPAKYSGDGEGIINIVLKKGFKVGFNGNLGVTSGVLGNANANANASYRGTKFAVNGSGAIRHNVGQSESHSYRQNIFPDTTFYYDTNAKSKSKSNGANGRAGLDWDITKKQNLKMSVNYNTNSSNSNSSNDLHYLSKQLVQSRLRNQINLGDGNSENFVLNTDYNLITDTSGSKLSFGLTLNGNNNNDFRQYNTSYIAKNPIKPTQQENNNKISNRGINLNLDFDKGLFKKRDRLEIGMAYIYRKNENNLLVQNFDFTKQVFNTNAKLSNQFYYNENIMAGYASYNYRQKGFSIKGGVRAEITNVDFDLSTGETYNVKPYLSIFPNIGLNKTFRKRYNIGSTYSIRVNRPREVHLNPQINNVDTLNISYGNPSLAPSYTHQFGLNFGVFGLKWSFTPRITYSRSEGVIERYRNVYYVPGSSTARSEATFENVGTNNSFALILLGNYRPTNKISSNANFSLIQNNYSSNLNSALNRSGLSYRGSLGLTIQTAKRLGAEANVNYANNANAQGRNKGSVTTSFAIRKTLLSNRLNLRLTANDVFANRKNTSYNEGTNFILNSQSKSYTQNYSLSLNYRFTKMSKVSNVKVPPPPSATPAKP
jgi:hypothetical protein